MSATSATIEFFIIICLVVTNMLAVVEIGTDRDRIIKSAPEALESLQPATINLGSLYIRVGPRNFKLEIVNGALGIVLFKSHDRTFVPMHKLPILDYWYNLVYSESIRAGNYAEFGDWRVYDKYVKYGSHRVTLRRDSSDISLFTWQPKQSDIYPLIALSMTEDESQIW